MTEVAETARVPTKAAARAPQSLVRRVRLLVSGAVAAVLGLLPHILHHAGPLAGAALFAGAAGSLVFGALGLVAAIPFLLRMKRRCGGWSRPLATLAVFAAVFLVSTFVVGPVLTGDDKSEGEKPAATPAEPTPSSHDRHH